MPNATDSVRSLGLAGALVLTGGLVVSQPLLAVGVVLAVAMAAAVVVSSTTAAFVSVLVLFPILPGRLEFEGLAVQPQRALIVVLLLLVLANPALMADARSRLRQFRRPLGGFAAFLVVGVVSGAVSPLPRAALLGVGFYALNVGLALLVGLMYARRGSEDAFWVGFSIAAIGVGLISVLEYLFPGLLLQRVFGGFEAGVFAGDETRVLASRVSGPFGHPVGLGTFGALLLPFALRATALENRRSATVGACGVIMLLVGIFVSQTRIALLVAPVVIVFWLMGSDRRARGTSVAVVTLVVLAGTFGVSTLASQGRVLGEVLAYRGERKSADRTKNNVARRSSLYVAGWAAFKARPVVGYGFRVPSQHYREDIFTRFGRVLGFESYYVALMVESGLLGVLAFAFFIISLLGTAVRRLVRRVDRVTILAALLSGALVSIAAPGFDVPVAYFWLLMGMTFGLGLNLRPQPESRPILGPWGDPAQHRSRPAHGERVGRSSARDVTAPTPGSSG